MDHEEIELQEGLGQGNTEPESEEQTELRQLRRELSSLRRKYQNKSTTLAGHALKKVREPVASIPKYKYHPFRDKPVEGNDQEHVLFSSTDRELLRTVTTFDDKYVQNAMGQFICAMLGIVLMLIENIFSWDATKHTWSAARELMLTITGPMITLTTLLAIYYTVNYYKVRIHEYNLAHRHRVGAEATIWTLPQHRTRMLLEILVLFWHPIPFTPLDERFGLLMWLRLFTVTRVIKVTSPVYQRRRAIVRSQILEETGNPRFSWQLAGKLLFTRSPVLGTIIFLCTIYVISTLNIYITERNASLDFSLGNSFWFSMVTMTTIGYGDLYPESPRGRAAAMIGAVAGILTMSLLTGTIAANLALDRKKELCKKYESEERWMNLYQYHAAAVIQTVFRKRKCKTEVERTRLFNKTQVHVYKFRRNYKRVQNSRNQLTVDERLQSIELRLKQLEDRFDEMFQQAKESSKEAERVQRLASQVLAAVGTQS